MHPTPLTAFRSLKDWRRHNLFGIALNIGFAIGGVVFARLLGTLTQIILARQLGVSDYGVYSTVYILLGPVIVMTSLGLDTWLLRQGGITAGLDQTISQVFSIRLLATTVLMTIGVVVILASGQPELRPLLVIAAAFGLLAELLLVTGYTALRAQLRNIAAIVLQVAAAAAFFLLVFWGWNDQSPLLAATGYRLLSAVAGVALLVWMLRSTFRLHWHLRSLWQIIKQARVFFVSDFLANIALKADVTMVALLLGSLAVGIYNPALTIINTTFLAPHVMWQVLLPMVAQQRWGSLQSRLTVGLALVGSVVYGLCCAALLYWGAEWLVHLIYNEQFNDSAPLLRIMFLIPLLKSLNFCWAMLMVALDAQVLRTKLQAVGAVVNVFGNLLFIPFFGLVAVAWVNLLTDAVLFVCYSYGFWITAKRQQ
ncbi:MAG: oligosaccharide flippase family protein [Chloroflexales bacterium]|nr:oligosaccharide flippase family protein [Chloroflexales bacterium]